MIWKAAKSKVANRRLAPDDFLNEIVAIAKVIPDEVFASRPNPKPPEKDIFNILLPHLGDKQEDGKFRWRDLSHRKAAALEMLRVLGLYESSCNWRQGKDTSNPSENTPEKKSAGLWQISYNSRVFGDDLKAMLMTEGIGLKSDGERFQEAMKERHRFAMEYTLRLLRHTHRHNGPVKRGEILEWLNRDAMAEFETALNEGVE